ncbi:MAG TPA: protein kinase [Gemmatimonadales bacterium]|nr:protein kinase [Gemmatimonadales bacterium]
MTDVESQLGRALEGRYRLTRLLGEGGMARVYLAEDIKHGREVALKVLRPDLAATLGPERFQREIATAARLQHPHILTVFDSGNADGVLWFTMPFVEGESLRSRLARERQLPVDEAVRIAREVAQALQYAHDHGVIHRDIKPDNILLTGDGNTLVADFGIARGFGDGNATPLTRTGMSLGTPAYMSPEQASGDRDVDARSDVYAIGAVLYEMLAGEPPFTGPTPEAIIAKRFTTTSAPIRTTRSTVSVELDQAITRSLALVPGDRFATAAEFASAIGGVNDGTGVAARPRGGHGWKIPAAIALGLLVAAAAVFRMIRDEPPLAGVVDTSTPRIVVLPFENRGDTADAYFADGMTDAVRGKLSLIPGLEVIARGSSTPYLGSTKSLTEIARELGVRYLLTGVIRFERNDDGNASVVHLAPELVEVSDDGTPTARWQQPFDQPLTNVFRVQAEIADSVAGRISAALTRPAQLASIPTTSTAAYDALLRAEALRGRSDPGALREVVSRLETAVALDSNFAEAWAALSTAEGNLWVTAIGANTAERAARIRHYAERAMRLDPTLPRAYRAMGGYFRVIANNPDSAMALYREGLRHDPNDAALINSSASVHLERREYEQGLALLQTAIRLDPKQAFYHSRAALAYTALGDFDAAEDAYRLANSLQPAVASYVAGLVDVVLRRGDLAGARRIVSDAAKEMSPELIYTFIATYGDYVWLLDSTAQEMAMAAPLERYGDDAATRDLVRAQIWYLRGDSALARLWGDSAATHYTAFLRQHRGDVQATALRYLALALAGRSGEARRGADSISSLQLVYRGAQDDMEVYARHVTARTWIALGENRKAVDLLEEVVRTTRFEYELTPGRLRVDPNFDPLRNDPEFRSLAGMPP